MAGLAAIMTRKKRDRRRELEQRNHLHSEDSFSEVVAGKEAQQKKANNETIKKLLIGKELMRQKSKSSDALSQDYYDRDDGAFKNGNAYSSVYIGLVLICIGLVITFVGLGEKGFKTLELKLIGPVLCVIGLVSIVFKILQCTFPKLFQMPSFLKNGNKLADTDHPTLMEKGVQNGHFGNQSNKNSPQILSPRVTLQSSKKTPRPRSTIPNYIEDSSEDDDFDPGRSRPHSNRYVNEQSQSQQPPVPPLPPPQIQQQTQKSNEILLNPKNLML